MKPDASTPELNLYRRVAEVAHETGCSFEEAMRVCVDCGLIRARKVLRAIQRLRGRKP